MQVLGPNDLNRAVDRGHVNFGVVASGTKSVYVDCSGLDLFSAQIVWQGTLAATVTVFESNSYVPGDDLQGGTAVRAGVFTDVTTADYSVPTMSSPGGGTSSGFVKPKPDREHPLASYIRIDIARTAGSGQLDVYLSGKRLGVP